MARSVARAAGKKKTAKPPDLDEILGHFNDALALVETAYGALGSAQESDGIGPAIGSAMRTLERGLTELRRAYTELDLAILGHRKGGVS